MTRPRLKETELAAPVVSWLVNEGWEVYQEVTLDTGIADIVAVMDRRVWVIEAKVSIGISVISQADRWHRIAHWRSVLVPRIDQFACAVCEWRGVGVIVAYPGVDNVRVEVPAALNRKARVTGLLSRLMEEQKTFAEAGSKDQRRWTPYLATCRRIARYVHAHPGCCLKELVDSIDTHYSGKSTAKQCISHWAREGKVPGVRTERDGNKLRFYTNEGEARA